jgi:hypothetical protein
MRVLVQNNANLLFLKQGGDWTNDAEDALDFEHSFLALTHITKAPLTNVQIVLRFNRRELDVVLATTPRPTGFRRFRMRLQEHPERSRNTLLAMLCLLAFEVL